MEPQYSLPHMPLPQRDDTLSGEEPQYLKSGIFCTRSPELLNRNSLRRNERRVQSLELSPFDRC